MTAFLYLCIVLQLLHLTVGVPPPIVLLVSFESTAVSIPEGTSADVCLTITGTAAGPITILLGATDQSASNYTLCHGI
uniref:IPT/TIG domain-containing protein n=1 Tax=Amphimedon queenslandica TaxID=400682 RepID=A0A1X7SSC0_AMPQE